MQLTEQQQRQAAKEFAEYWNGKGYEKGESQKFWIDLLGSVYGVESPAHFLEFEDKVMLDNTSFIDVFIPSTKVMIEQKSIGKSLSKAIRQSDGSLLTPFQQAKRYSAELPYSKRPRWIVTCNFEEFYIYDMENPNGEPEKILLKDLPKEYYRLGFLVDTGNENIKKEMEISIKAGELVGILYEALLKQYNNPQKEELQSLNMLCVRLVFCLYAEDAGIFGRHNMFHDYLAGYDTRHWRKALKDLFEILNTKIEDRDEYLEDELAQFPYVNGGLFADNTITIPQMTEDIRTLVLEKSSENFDWSEISPTIFGAVFESTLNPDTRRSGGMHYTSIENIHKVIDPLFLDDLHKEFAEIKELKQVNVRKQKLEEFCEKLGSLKFLDPACGSGNFLTETYISLRKLENKALELILEEQTMFDDSDKIKVTIDQFYGIEINDFAVNVAKTALWIAESQMIKETESIISRNIDFLPLTTNAFIVEGNALQIDWEDVVPKSELNYIMGNPPFVGARLMDKSQKQDMELVFGKLKGLGNLDYVSAWYKKASDYIDNTKIETAFVSTNSITQGEQVSILWKNIIEKGLIINFAHRTFRWDSEASLKAHVHCVIIGFSYIGRLSKLIFTNESVKQVNNINPFLIEAPNVFIESKSKPVCDVPKMDFGSMPNDKGYLSNYSKERKDEICRQYPNAEKLFKKILGAEEFINNKERYCIWLDGVSPNEYKNISPIMEAIKSVKEIREQSTREATRKLADTPYLFGEIRQPKSDYLLIPSTSSENRRYIPIGFIESSVISSNANLVISNATMFIFGVLISNVHMAWMRTVAGRLKSDYRYSAKIVYNNFPWCNPTDEQKAKIEQTAQAILDARAKYPDCSLADLYDELTMPVELRKAHQANDKAVMQAYGFSLKMTESECVAELMKMYQKLVEG